MQEPGSISKSDSGICKALCAAGGQKHAEGQEAGWEGQPRRDFKQGSDMARSGFGKECLASQMKPEGKRARLEESWSYLFEPHLRT